METNPPPMIRLDPDVAKAFRTAIKLLPMRPSLTQLANETARFWIAEQKKKGGILFES